LLVEIEEHEALNSNWNTRVLYENVPDSQRVVLTCAHQKVVENRMVLLPLNELELCNRFEVTTQLADVELLLVGFCKVNHALLTCGCHHQAILGSTAADLILVYQTQNQFCIDAGQILVQIIDDERVEELVFSKYADLVQKANKNML
jgi:hypothetical protein